MTDEIDAEGTSQGLMQETKDAVILALHKFEALQEQMERVEDHFQDALKCIEQLEQWYLIKVFALPISRLGLSTRAYNILRTARLWTVGHVATRTREQLARYRNCGRQTLDEIEAAMAEIGVPMGFNPNAMRNAL